MKMKMVVGCLLRGGSGRKEDGKFSFVLGYWQIMKGNGLVRFGLGELDSRNKSFLSQGEQANSLSLSLSFQVNSKTPMYQLQYLNFLF